MNNFERNFAADMNGVADRVSASMATGYNPAGNAYDNGSGMVSAFKRALSEMKIELDGEAAGKFVDRTVSNLMYA